MEKKAKPTENDTGSIGSDCFFFWPSLGWPVFFLSLLFNGAGCLRFRFFFPVLFLDDCLFLLLRPDGILVLAFFKSPDNYFSYFMKPACTSLYLGRLRAVCREH